MVALSRVYFIWNDIAVVFVYLFRIKELFNIIVEFPESLPALQDLKECLQHTNLRGFLKSSLKAAYVHVLIPTTL